MRRGESDTEQVPLLDEGGIEGFLRRATCTRCLVDPTSVKIGYEISFTRYFSVIPSPSSLHRHPASLI